MDCERNHSVGSPMDGTPPQSEDRLSLIGRSLSVFGLWGSPVHRTPHAVITLTIHYDHPSVFIVCIAEVCSVPFCGSMKCIMKWQAVVCFLHLICTTGCCMACFKGPIPIGEWQQSMDQEAGRSWWVYTTYSDRANTLVTFGTALYNHLVGMKLVWTAITIHVYVALILLSMIWLAKV